MREKTQPHAPIRRDRTIVDSSRRDGGRDESQPVQIEACCSIQPLSNVRRLDCVKNTVSGREAIIVANEKKELLATDEIKRHKICADITRRNLSNCMNCVLISRIQCNGIVQVWPVFGWYARRPVKKHVREDRISKTAAATTYHGD